ncbi:MAG: GNAT family N-acetyltransferase [Gammaproteobacteria bacterium]|jgi:ribosomal protein S18 acetylase RimI-like enzyme|nr:GNAT family N-acetyltransferase [Gammaproteobacteria bacterium]MBT4605857.1 GNAT family N-acetyltransferase [Thiotrichales bacterium]MBT3471565.1 GNAT family N-acetyltransferase [Gammaproteobacteria bacterium]MBT3967883.1 GNAT family N-acetyltransferase [Gammaproteobacteria bacterium]MBT4081565.1 GNAT family N-acetyltransferase [Gammaproteobacteria bacterium]
MIKIQSIDSEVHFAAVRVLLREYIDSRPNDPALLNVEAEFQQLEHHYGPPKGVMLLAHQDQNPAGCVAFHPLEDGICEMKRLYVSPRFRGSGIGRGLVMTLLIEAEKAGYQKMRLDSIPSMGAAQELYEKIGFYQIPDYRNNPNPGTRYYEINFKPEPSEVAA